MKPLSWDKQLGLVSPLKHAASQSNETNNPSKNETGLDVSHHTHVSPEGRGKYVFLDILFHRMSDIGILQQVGLFWRSPHIRLCPKSLTGLAPRCNMRRSRISAQGGLLC